MWRCSLCLGTKLTLSRVEGQKFFVYGSIFVEAEAARRLHASIKDLRDHNGLGSTDSLKFATSTRPKGMPVASAEQQLMKH